LATAVSNRELIEAVAAEMSAGIECVLDFWMSQIEGALEDPRLTTLGRLNAVQEILSNYRRPAAQTAATGGYAA
jgi:hypothetical protein